MVKCPKCDFDLKFCNNCGQLLPPLEKMPRDSKNNLLCPFCKEIIMYCPYCGYNFSEIKIQEEIPIPNIEKIDPKIIESLIEKIKEESIEKEILEIKNEGKTINFQENLFCSFHPSKKANKECDICSKPICEECIKKYGDLIICPDDYYSIIRELHSFSIKSERKKLISFFLSIISAFLILGNAFLWIYPLSIFPVFSIFIFLENSYLAIISAIFSFIIALGAFLSLKREISGGIIIMIFSLASLTLGGGFLIGSILGIVGAMTNLIIK